MATRKEALQSRLAALQKKLEEEEAAEAARARRAAERHAKAVMRLLEAKGLGDVDMERLELILDLGLQAKLGVVEGAADAGASSLQTVLPLQSPE